MLRIQNLHKKYGEQIIFQDLNIHFKKGKNYIILGPSGIGKSTLLNLISQIDTSYKGNIILDTHKISYVFQEDRLLPWLSVEKNIEYVMKEKEDISHLLKLLEIDNIKNKLASELSGGQKQRVASARAIITNPSLVLADEPTGALDSKSAKMLLESLEELNTNLGATIMMVTHDAFTASYASRILFIKDGKIFNELIRGKDSRKEFFNKIIEVVTLLGGDQRDVF